MLSWFKAKHIETILCSWHESCTHQLEKTFKCKSSLVATQFCLKLIATKFISCVEAEQLFKTKNCVTVRVSTFVKESGHTVLATPEQIEKELFLIEEIYREQINGE